MATADGQGATSIIDAPVSNSQEKQAPAAKVDIEHSIVVDDPRKWSRTRKVLILTLISAASVITGLGTSIYTPAIAEVEADLNATSSQISISLAVFTIIQGGFPLIWTSFSEIMGRKIVYLSSITLATVGALVAATSKNIGVLIGMRCVQAAGSSAVLAIGAATLADIFEPAERGTMMGLYYCAPLVGPALGPILGGVLTQAFNWRATFWFYGVFCGVCVVAFIFFQDTFRRERSLTYQIALKRATDQQMSKGSETSSLRNIAVVKDISVGEKDTVMQGAVNEVDRDLESQAKDVPTAAPNKEIKLSLRDVNPIGPIGFVVRRPNNLVTWIASAFIFSFSFCITYTCARTMANVYYYNALEIGLVLLSFGIGSMVGSILGGRWSDRVFAHLEATHGGTVHPEMRLGAAKIAMPFLPLFVLAYGWICENHVHISAVCVMLFFAGFFSIAMYASTLAYIVDANAGRSSSAVAINSSFRGLLAFIATEVAVPLQDLIGDGGLYTLWAGLLIVAELLLILVWWKGGKWRIDSEAKEARKTGRPA